MKNFTHYINGIWEKAHVAKIPFNDAGFLLGDGLFETIRFDNKKLFKPYKHLERLFTSLDIIHINLEYPKEEIAHLLNEIIRRNDLQSGLLRLMVTRGDVEGPPWKYEGAASIYISIRPLSVEPNMPVKVIFYSETNYPIIRYTPAIKSMNYIGNMLAKKDAEKDNAFEPVFYNRDGFITECAIRNIFFIKENTILTPSKNLGVLPGVMRNVIISISKDLQFDIKETNIPMDSINSMDEAFISSTGIGLLPCYWDNWQSDFIITSKIKKNLNQLINNN